MKNVTIFTTPTCGYCHAAKDFFAEHKVPYQEKNVAQDEAARNEMLEKTGQMGVPVIQVGEDIIIGFDQARLQQLLELA